MTGVNHAVTGALVATAVNKPLLALPAALLSHFVIDMLPHWDYYQLTTKESKRWTNGVVDFGLSLILLTIFALMVNAPAWLIFIGGLLGILPDAMWLRYLIWRQPSISGNERSLLNRIRAVHIKMQWLETSKIYGLYAEIIWLALTTWLMFQINS